MPTTKQRISVMLIDDDRLIVVGLSAYLDYMGFQVSGYTSPAEGLEAVRTNPPDLCIVDLRMGGVSGEDVVREIHKIAPKVRCMFLTGDRYEVPTDLLALGISQDDVLQKPVHDLDQLARKIA